MPRAQYKRVHLSDSVINGTVLKKGDYRVEFSTSGAGEATISRNGKVILKVPYTLETLPEKAERKGTYYRVNSEGVRELTRIVFDGYSVAIVFG